MSESAGSWISPDGTQLGYKIWSSDARSRATVLALHGLSCREDDFAPLGVAISEKNIRVAAWNLRGQGLDPVQNRRGAWLDVDGMISDLRAFAEEFVEPNEPLFLAGDSMGALIALQAAVREPWNNRIAGLMLFSPVVELAQKNPPWIKSLLIAVSRILPGLRLKPSWFVHGKRAAPQLTRIPERQQETITAPHRLGPTTIGFLVSMGNLIDGAMPAAPRLDVPVVVFSAGHDAFVTSGQTEDFVVRIRSGDRTHFHYAESYHQLLFDLDAAQVTRDALMWMEARIPTNTSRQ